MQYRTLARQERRTAMRYALLLLFDWKASRAERARWKALRSYHISQAERWEAKP